MQWDIFEFKLFSSTQAPATDTKKKHQKTPTNLGKEFLIKILSSLSSIVVHKKLDQKVTLPSCA